MRTQMHTYKKHTTLLLNLKLFSTMILQYLYININTNIKHRIKIHTGFTTRISVFTVLPRLGKEAGSSPAGS